MRSLIIVGLGLIGVGGAQDRADLLTPKTLTTTVRSYEITGIAVSLPPTFAAVPEPTLAMPASSSGWSLMIRYTDNLGVEHVDAHSPGTDAEKYVRLLILTPASGSMSARLLQHLIDEKKIPPARIQKGK